MQRGSEKNQAVIIFPVFWGGINLMQIYGNFKGLALNTALFGLVSQNDPWKNWKKLLSPPMDFFHVLVRLGAFFFALQKSFSGNTCDDFSVHLLNFFPKLLYILYHSIFSKLCQWIPLNMRSWIHLNEVMNSYELLVSCRLYWHLNKLLCKYIMAPNNLEVIHLKRLDARYWVLSKWARNDYIPSESTSKWSLGAWTLQESWICFQ